MIICTGVKLQYFCHSLMHEHEDFIKFYFGRKTKLTYVWNMYLIIALSQIAI